MKVTAGLQHWGLQTRCVSRRQYKQLEAPTVGDPFAAREMPS